MAAERDDPQAFLKLLAAAFPFVSRPPAPPPFLHPVNQLALASLVADSATQPYPEEDICLPVLLQRQGRGRGTRGDHFQLSSTATLPGLLSTSTVATMQLCLRLPLCRFEVFVTV